jgi:hypothetical protein
MTLRLLKSRRAWAVAILAGPVLVVLWWQLPPYFRGFIARLEPDQPWLIEFGRGSGWHGLDTVKVLQDGTVILHRGYDNSWETARLHLPKSALAQLLGAVQKNRLVELDREYDGAVADGTQWVLRVKMDDQQKAVYFNNSFPESIVQFAATFDEVLAANGLEKVAWRRVAYFKARAHEQNLWDSIKR